jgi:hypothetical protein
MKIFYGVLLAAGLFGWAYLKRTNITRRENWGLVDDLKWSDLT